MAIPLSYNLRSLLARRTTTLMTALGIALTVAMLASVLAMSAGLDAAFRATGHPLQLVLLRKGAAAEIHSQVPRAAFNEVIRPRTGIAKSIRGEPLASPEIVTAINLPSVDNPDGMNLAVRGLLPIGLALRDGLRVTAGRMFQPGRREVVVGAAIGQRYPDARLGGKLRFARGEWEVVGVFESPEPARNSEIWADANQVAADFGREEGYNSVLVRASDEVALQALRNEFNAEQRLQLEALREKDFYAAQTSSGNVIRFLGTCVAVILSVGSCFAAMNTMYAAVARRSKEIATLRVLGFSRAAILASFLVESLLLALLGGALGLVLLLPLHGFTTAVGASNFSEVAFQLKVTPGVAWRGMLFALVMGAGGGLLPAVNAARKQILTALRET